jgi:hypothetical protein
MFRENRPADAVLPHTQTDNVWRGVALKQTVVLNNRPSEPASDELLAVRRAVETNCDSHMRHMLRSLTSLPSSAQHKEVYSCSYDVFSCNWWGRQGSARQCCCTLPSCLPHNTLEPSTCFTVGGELPVQSCSLSVKVGQWEGAGGTSELRKCVFYFCCIIHRLKTNPVYFI